MTTETLPRPGARFAMTDPAAGDFASVLAERTDIRLSGFNPFLGEGLQSGRDWLVADLRPATLGGWWWISVVEFGTGIVAFQRLPQAAPRVPMFLAAMGVDAATFDVEPSVQYDYPPHDPPRDAPVGPVLRSVYFIQPVGGGRIKIGVSGSPESRLAMLQTGSPVDLRIVGLIPDAEPGTEPDLHARFAHLRVRGEWFEPAADLLAFIAENAS